MSFKQIHDLERVFKEYGLILVFRLANKDDLLAFIDPYHIGEIPSVVTCEGSLDVLVRNKAKLDRINPSYYDRQFMKDLRILDKIAQICRMEGEVRLSCALYRTLAGKFEKLIMRKVKDDKGSVSFMISEFSLFIGARDGNPYAVILDRDSGPPQLEEKTGIQLNLFPTLPLRPFKPLDNGVKRLHHLTARNCRGYRQRTPGKTYAL